MSGNKGYLGVAAIGALGGGIAVALSTRAVPTLLARMKSEMMRKMMAEMGQCGCGPAMSGACGGAESDEQPESVAATSAGCGCGAATTTEAVSEPRVV